MQVRIHKFDSIKATAMVSVIVLHAYGMGMSDSVVKRVLVVDVLGVSMYLFAFISGWMMRPRIWNFKIIAKLCVIGVMINTLVHFSGYSLGLMGQPNYLHSAWTLWYFWVLLICKVVLPVFRSPTMALLVSVAIFAMSFVCSLDVGANPMIGRLIGFSPFFALGYSVSNCRWAESVRGYIYSDRHMMSWRCVLVVIAVCAATASVSRYGFDLSAIVANRRGAIGCSFKGMLVRLGMLIVIAGWGLVWLKSIPSKELTISKFGTRTLAVYLLHTLPIFVCAAIGRSVFGGKGHYFIMSIAICFCILLFHQGFTDFFNMVVRLNWFTRRKGCEQK